MNALTRPSTRPTIIPPTQMNIGAVTQPTTAPASRTANESPDLIRTSLMVITVVGRTNAGW